MYIDRQEIVEELRLRKLIRKAIHIAEAKRDNAKQQNLQEEDRLRKVIRNLIAESEVGDTEDSPYDNTGLNTLNTLFDNILKTTCEDMLETMYNAKGIGLAAIQVNILKRIVVIDLSEEKNNPLIFINPEIIKISVDTKQHGEGCLSVPGIYEKVTRPD